MKYFILINQQVLSKTKLDIIDGAILDYIYFYCNSQNEKVKSQRITDKNEIWTWVDYSSLLEDMPMLKIKSVGAITERINKIENAGYIKTKRFQHMKKYFRMTAKSDGLFIQMNRAIHTDEQGYSSKRIAPIHIDEPIKNKDNKDKNIKRESTPSQNFLNFLNSPEQKRISLLEEKLERNLTAGEKSEIENFISYWTEKNQSGTKQRWQLERTFDYVRRIGTWFKNIDKFNNNFNKKNYGNSEQKPKSSKYSGHYKQAT